MKLAKNLSAIVFVALAVISMSAHAARLVPITEPSNDVPNVGDKPLSAQDVKKAIMKAALGRGWQIAKDSPGKIRLRLDDSRKGAYHLILDVTYSAQKYSIKYVSSEGLRYNEASKTIHGNYTRWINFLVQSINRELISAS